MGFKGGIEIDGQKRNHAAHHTRAERKGDDSKCNERNKGIQ